VVGKDPESQRVEMIKVCVTKSVQHDIIMMMSSSLLQKEEERLRAAVRRESLQKRVRERNSQPSRGGITASYLEPPGEVSILIVSHVEIIRIVNNCNILRSCDVIRGCCK